jgi:hypothetical protein
MEEVLNLLSDCNDFMDEELKTVGISLDKGCQRLNPLLRGVPNLPNELMRRF